jgi:hypothetical protein
MKMNIGMAFEPAFILGLMGIEIVQNEVNFCFVSKAIDVAIHEIQELPAASAFIMTGLNRMALKKSSIADRLCRRRGKSG